jgi:uncharacterized ion transporter superfamily protein YfcC
MCEECEIGIGDDEQNKFKYRVNVFIIITIIIICWWYILIYCQLIKKKRNNQIVLSIFFEKCFLRNYVIYFVHV